MHLAVGRDQQRVPMGDEVPTFTLVAPLGEESEPDRKLIRGALVVERKRIDPLRLGLAGIIVETSFEAVKGLVTVGPGDVVAVFDGSTGR